MPNILLKNISKRFSSDSLAVDNVTLEIKDGDFITLLGPSGCGKTTLLRMIAGLETPTEGEIYIDDELVFSSEKGVDLSPDKRNVGFLFQNYALWPNMTVFQNIAFGLENLKWDKEKIKDRVGELLELMQISDLGDRYPAELSGGQQQRVAIARTLATNPPTLLMDEPLSNLDAKLRTEMRTELKRLHLETGSTFVYVTHDQLEAMTLSTKICLVKRGVLQQYSPPLELYRSPINTFVADFVGNPNMNLLPMKATQEGDKITLHHQEVSLTFKVDEGTPKLEKDHPCILGLRPEKVIITENGTLKASVYSSLPSGMETIVSVKIGDLTITAVVFGTVDYAVGEEVGVDFSSAEYLLFDANTTEQVAMGTLEILSK